MAVRVDVTGVAGVPGAVREVDVEVPLDDPPAAFSRAQGPATVNGLLEGVLEGVVVAARVSAEVATQCRRCLRDLAEGVSTDVTELFSDDPDLAEADVYPISDHEIELDKLVRDTVVLALPETPLCRSDCAGLCVRCGTDLNDGPCGCPEEPGDPRWDVLAELFPDQAKET